jgi:protein-disulfide isomerase
MRIKLAVLKPIIFAIVGASSAATFFLMRENWNKSRFPVSNALCFLKETGEERPIAQFDNIPISKENLPADLYTTYLQIETENYKRLSEIARQMALRMDAMTAEERRRPADAPAFRKVLKKEVTEQDALEFYKANPKAFAGAPFEKVSTLVRDMLQNREDDLLLSSKIQTMEKENRFHMLTPAPCGAKTKVPYSNTLPGRGNTTAQMNLLVTFNFDCSQCRATAKELVQFNSQNLEKLRVWYMPIPGERDSRNTQFARLFQCAFNQSPSSIADFYEKIYDLPFARSAASDGHKELLELAVKAGLDRSKAETCMNDPKIAQALEVYSQFATDHQMGGETPRYFLNERGMAPDVGIGIVKVMKNILSERERLKDVL